MKRKRLQSVLMVLALTVCCISGCRRGTDEPGITSNPSSTQKPGASLTTTPLLTETPVKVRNLNGLQIIIGDTYSSEITPAPTNAMDQAISLYREDLRKMYNFTIGTKKVADWEEMEDVYINSVRDGKPVAQVFELDYRFLAKPMKMGLFYDLATLKEFDFTRYKWDDTVTEVMTRGDSIYGMRATRIEAGGGLLWNKRLFKEAGLDPDLPYDLQECGEWTWSKFEELCSMLTRDTDEDGLIDVYATCSDGTDTLQCLVSSTGKDFLAVNEDGTIYNNCKDKDVLSAMEFAAELYKKGYEMPEPDDAAEDWQIAAFQNGKAAMQFGEEALCKPDAPYGENCMTDEVGFVVLPKPDGQKEYHTYVYGNVWVIPSCYDAETASDIAFAYNLYTEEVPGYDYGVYDEPYEYDDYSYDFYRSGKYDERVLKETLPLFHTGETANFLTCYLVDGFSIHDLTKHYPFRDSTPEECVEEVWDSWQELIDESNEEIAVTSPIQETENRPEDKGSLLTKTKRELCTEVFQGLSLNPSEWFCEILYKTSNEAFLLLYPPRVQVTQNGTCAELQMSTKDFIYLVSVKQQGEELLLTPVKEYGVSQVGVFSSEQENYVCCGQAFL